MVPSIRRPSRVVGSVRLEVVATAMGLLTVFFLLTPGLSASQRPTTRELEEKIANDAIRSYVERVRETYPRPGSSNLGELARDTGREGSVARMTPLDFLPPDAGGLIQDATATVQWTLDETGTCWLDDAGSLMSEEDRTALGLPRDLDGDGVACKRAVGLEAIRLIPCKIELSWAPPGEGPEAPRRTVTAYFSFSVFH